MQRELVITEYSIPHMDCAAEEEMVRMALADRSEIEELRFNLASRTLRVVHAGDDAGIGAALHALDLGAQATGSTFISMNEAESLREVAGDDSQQRRLLIVVLAINASLFALEMGVGLVANSMGLVADSLDMLADALVYGLSLYAVGRSLSHKKRVAGISGYLQLALALFGIIEVVRRALGAGEAPEYALMIVVSCVALAGNVASLLIIQRSRSQEAHMRASAIFSANDVIVNLGVIAAAILVSLTGSGLPDLVIGAIVFALVARGAFRILALSK